MISLSQKGNNVLLERLCLRKLDKKERKNAAKRGCALAIFFILICVILFFGQCFIEDALQSKDLSETFVNSSIKFNTGDMTVSGAFISSYIHRTDDNKSHLMGNLLTCFVSAGAIVLFTIYREYTKFPLPSKYYHWIIGTLFIIFPFLFALIFKLYDYMFHQNTGMVCCGFSGIVFALVGVFAAQILSYLTNTLYSNLSQNGLRVFLTNPILQICCGLFLSFFFACTIGLYSGNVFVHCAGVSGGFLVAYFFDIWPQSQHQDQLSSFS